MFVLFGMGQARPSSAGLWATSISFTCFGVFATCCGPTHIHTCSDCSTGCRSLSWIAQHFLGACVCGVSQHGHSLFLSKCLSVCPSACPSPLGVSAGLWVCVWQCAVCLCVYGGRGGGKCGGRGGQYGGLPLTPRSLKMPTLCQTSSPRGSFSQLLNVSDTDFVWDVTSLQSTAWVSAVPRVPPSVRVSLFLVQLLSPCRNIRLGTHE